MAYREKTIPFNVSNTTGFLGAGSIPAPTADNFYEIEIGIVTHVYADDPGKIKIYTFFSKQQLDAYPLNQNIKSVPLIGELVVYREYKLAKNIIEGQKLNFYEALSWYSSPHANDFPDFLDYILNQLKTSPTIGIDLEKVQGTLQSIKQNNAGLYFKKDLEQFSKKLINLEGNILIEGRSGQSIRFGSAISKKYKFEDDKSKSLLDKATWKYSNNEEQSGNPFIIISNGKTNTNKNFAIEDIANDPSTIFLTMGGQSGVDFPFLLSAIKNKPKSSTIPNSYNDNMILLNSDRLVFNSKSSDIIISSNKDLVAMSNKNIYLKTKNVAELQASSINLGENAKNEGQPVARANDLMIFLYDMMDAILALKYDNYGFIISGTDTQLIRLQERLARVIDKRDNSNVFSSRTTFTL